MKHQAWLTLAHAYVNVAELIALKDHFGDIDTIVGQSEQRLRDAGLAEKKAKAVSSPDQKGIEAALLWLREDRHNIVTCGTDEYPEMLGQLRGAPLLLFVNGDRDALHLPSLADTAAHRGALDVGGRTVAFLGHGIDRVYPARNHDLAHQITETGALVTEYPLGAPPDKRHFPERNRLISGLSLGTLVIEAARRSGSLITARLAAEQGREVFALPGSIHNPLARGCHELIRQGAKLVETAADISAELAPLTGYLQQNVMESTNNKSPLSDDDNDYAELRKVLSHDPITIDDLQSQSGLTIEQLSSMLLILELHGDVESLFNCLKIRSRSKHERKRTRRTDVPL
jgi:DNA processing protein